MSEQLELAKLGHVALVTPNMEKSLWFFQDVIGLEETETVGDTVYLRGWGDFEHHTLSITPGKTGYVDHIGWKAKRPEDLEKYAKILEQSGTEVKWVEAGEESGQGRAIRFKLPSQHTFEIYFDMEKPLADPSRRSILKNQVYKPWRKGVSPRRIDHVNVLTSTNVKTTTDFLSEKMGFKMREYIKGMDENNPIFAGWMSVTPLVHDIAVCFEPTLSSPSHIHHMAYWLDNAQDLLRAADILTEAGLKFTGPGKHGISQAMYIYVVDPGSGLRVELFTNGYLIFEPDWEPIEWTFDEMDIGFTFWGDQADNRPENNPTIPA